MLEEAGFSDVVIGQAVDTFAGAAGEANARAYEVYGYAFLARPRADRRTDCHPEAQIMSATIGLVLDCADPTRLATFWSEALGYTTAGEAGNYVLLVPTDSGPPKLLLQAVAEPKTTKNRMHLDIETPDVDAEVIRLESLGAHRLETDAVRARVRAG